MCSTVNNGRSPRSRVRSGDAFASWLHCSAGLSPLSSSSRAYYFTIVTLPSPSASSRIAFCNDAATLESSKIRAPSGYSNDIHSTAMLATCRQLARRQMPETSCHAFQCCDVAAAASAHLMHQPRTAVSPAAPQPCGSCTSGSYTPYQLQRRILN